MRAIQLPSDRDEAEKIFGVYHTCCFAGNPTEDIGESRKLGKVQDILEDISHEEDVPKDELPEGVKKDTRRVLDEGITDIHLDDAYCDFLKSRIWGAGIAWIASATRRAVTAYDACDQAEDVKNVVGIDSLAPDAEEAV